MPTDSAASDKAFVDTNVFVYAEDRREPVKRGAALALIRQLTRERRLAISTQVLNEFCAVLLRGRVSAEASEFGLLSLVEEVEAAAEILVVTSDVTREAIHAVFRYGMSWYDALIWAAAKKAGCTLIYTEDVPGMPEIEGVRYVNPFTIEVGD